MTTHPARGARPVRSRRVSVAAVAVLTAVLLAGAAVLVPGVLAPSSATAGPVRAAATGPDVAWSTLGEPPVPADGSGYTAVGPLGDGFVALTGERFVAAASGSVALLRLPVRRFGEEGDGAFLVEVRADDAGRPGATVGRAEGRAPGPEAHDTAPVTLWPATPVRLRAGAAYWLVVEPSPGTRLAWAVTPGEAAGPHLAVDAWGSTITTAPQGAFEVRLAEP